MRIFFYITLLLLTFSACKVSEESIVGIYQSKEKITPRLILKKDKTFEFAGANPYSASERLNIFTTGTWQLNKNKLILNSFLNDSTDYETGMTDSITRFTSISSFNFWNSYGDPISIRSILLPPAKPKPYFGNNLYWFAQDFKVTDTVKFYFEGYPDFVYPGSVPYAIGNNTHKIILRESYKPGTFNNTIFRVKLNKLFFSETNSVLNKKK